MVSCMPSSKSPFLVNKCQEVATVEHKLKQCEARATRGEAIITCVQGATSAAFKPSGQTCRPSQSNGGRSLSSAWIGFREAKQLRLNGSQKPHSFLGARTPDGSSRTRVKKQLPIVACFPTPPASGTPKLPSRLETRLKEEAGSVTASASRCLDSAAGDYCAVTE